MSTTINVTVDDGGLPARNKQQVAANRQAYIQTKAAEQSAEQGEAERRLNRLGRGLDPATGEPLIPPVSASTLSRFSGAGIPRLDQRPAANRISTAPLANWFSVFPEPLKTYKLYIESISARYINTVGVGLFNADKTIQRYYAFAGGLYLSSGVSTESSIDLVTTPYRTSGIAFNKGIVPPPNATLPRGSGAILIFAKNQPEYSESYMNSGVFTTGTPEAYQDQSYGQSVTQFNSFEISFKSNLGRYPDASPGVDNATSFSQTELNMYLLDSATNYYKYLIRLIVVPYFSPPAPAGEFVTFVVAEFQDGVRYTASNPTVANTYQTDVQYPKDRFFPATYAWGSYRLKFNKLNVLTLIKDGVTVLSGTSTISIKPAKYIPVIDFKHIMRHYSLTVNPYFALSDFKFTYS